MTKVVMVGVVCLVGLLVAVGLVYATVQECDDAVVGNGMVIGYDDQNPYSPDQYELRFYEPFENWIALETSGNVYISGGCWQSYLNYITFGADGKVQLETDSQEVVFGSWTDGQTHDGARILAQGDIVLESACATASAKVTVASAGSVVFRLGNDD